MPPFKSIPTVDSLNAVVQRVAARLVVLETELSGADDTQLGKVWESIEELNLRVLFLMNTLQITEKLSNIADSSGNVPVVRMNALQAYSVGSGDGRPSGRERLIAMLEQQERDMRARAKKNAEASSAQGLPQVEGADSGVEREGDTPKENGAEQKTDGAETSAPHLVPNSSTTKH